MTPRPNDKVCVWSNMTRVGTVKQVLQTNTESWYVGGTPGKTLKAEVQFTDGRVELHKLNELKVLERP